jgi:predicted nucleotidyltransferase component of viral defense system
MSEPKEVSAVRTANFQAWEDAAASDRQTQKERIASEIFLAALGLTENFRNKIFLKGGILVGAVYESGRNTSDLDFSTTLKPSTDFLERLKGELEKVLPAASAIVGSPNTIMKVQSVTYRPRESAFVEANAPAIEVKFGYAERGTKGETRLNRGDSSDVIYADISFNEEVVAIQEICIGDTGLSFFAYSKCDLIAEKIRSVLQQKIRKRNRRQDIYDLWFLLENHPVSDDERSEIKSIFLQKCRSRDIEPSPNALEDDEVIERSKAEWETLESEVEYLPSLITHFVSSRPFMRCFGNDRAFSPTTLPFIPTAS